MTVQPYDFSTALLQQLGQISQQGESANQYAQELADKKRTLAAEAKAKQDALLQQQAMEKWQAGQNRRLDALQAQQSRLARGEQSRVMKILAEQQKKFQADYNRRMAELRASQSSATGGGGYDGGGTPAMIKGDAMASKFINAIVGQESGGNYSAVNPDSGASGRYQIMPGNIGPWSREILGRTVSVSQFRNSPKLQDQIAQGKLLQYYRKYGAAGAAVAWYAGPGTAAKYVRNPSAYNKRQGGGKYPSINGYAMSILRRMGVR